MIRYASPPQLLSVCGYWIVWYERRPNAASLELHVPYVSFNTLLKISTSTWKFQPLQVGLVRRQRELWWDVSVMAGSIQHLYFIQESQIIILSLFGISKVSVDMRKVWMEGKENVCSVRHPVWLPHVFATCWVPPPRHSFYMFGCYPKYSLPSPPLPLGVPFVLSLYISWSVTQKDIQLWFPPMSRLVSDVASSATLRGAQLSDSWCKRQNCTSTFGGMCCGMRWAIVSFGMIYLARMMG